MQKKIRFGEELVQRTLTGMCEVYGKIQKKEGANLPFLSSNIPLTIRPK